VTIGGFWIDDWIYWTLIQLVTTPHKSLLHTNQCSQLSWLVTASKGRHSSASGPTSLQAGDHPMPTSYSRCRLTRLIQMASHMAPARTQQKTVLPTVPLLLHVYLLRRSCDLVAVDTCLQSHCLATASCLGCSSLAMAVPLAPLF
jgi:hypothetical protein